MLSACWNNTYWMELLPACTSQLLRELVRLLLEIFLFLTSLVVPEGLKPKLPLTPPMESVIFAEG